MNAEDKYLLTELLRHFRTTSDGEMTVVGYDELGDIFECRVNDSLAHVVFRLKTAVAGGTLDEQIEEY